MNKVRYAIVIAAAAAVIIAAAVIGGALSTFKMPDSPPAGTLRVVFFSVGNADCSLYFNEDVAVMIDAPEGEIEEAAGYMRRVGIVRLDCLIITHYDSDHCGGAADILREFGADTVIMPLPGVQDAAKYEKIAEAAENSAIRIPVSGDVYEFSDVSVKILSPDAFVTTEEENVSVVTLLSYGGGRVLSCGDISSDMETHILNKFGYGIKCDILKVAHHGSRYSSGEEFISAAAPRYAVISCGDNTYGHPSQEVLSLLEEKEIETVITQKTGNSVFDITSSGVERLR